MTFVLTQTENGARFRPLASGESRGRAVMVTQRSGSPWRERDHGPATVRHDSEKRVVVIALGHHDVVVKLSRLADRLRAWQSATGWRRRLFRNHRRGERPVDLLARVWFDDPVVNRFELFRYILFILEILREEGSINSCEYSELATAGEKLINLRSRLLASFGARDGPR